MPIDFNEFEKTLGLEEGVLSTANSSEEDVKVDLSHLKVFKIDDYNKLQENTALEHQQALEQKQAYSRQAATEEDTKFYRKELGLDFTGKSREQLLDAFKAKLHIGGDSAKEITELQDKLDAHKQGLEDYKVRFEEQESSYKKLQESIQADKDLSYIDSQLEAELKKYDKSTLSIKDAKVLLKNSVNLKLSDGKINLYKGDDIIKDDLKDNLSLSDYVESFMPQYLPKVQGGRGDENYSSVGKMSVDKFHKAWTKQNPSGSNVDFNTALFAKQKAGEIED